MNEVLDELTELHKKIAIIQKRIIIILCFKGVVDDVKVSKSR